MQTNNNTDLNVNSDGVGVAGPVIASNASLISPFKGEAHLQLYTVSTQFHPHSNVRTFPCVDLQKC